MKKEDSMSVILDPSKVLKILSGSIYSRILESYVIIKNKRIIFVSLKFDEAIATAQVIILQGDEKLNSQFSLIEDFIKLPFVDYRPLARDLYENFNKGDILSDMYYKCIADIYKQMAKK